jgi:hypothetical protein
MFWGTFTTGCYGNRQLHIELRIQWESDPQLRAAAFRDLPSSRFDIMFRIGHATSDARLPAMHTVIASCEACECFKLKRSGSDGRWTVYPSEPFTHLLRTPLPILGDGLYRTSFLSAPPLPPEPFHPNSTSLDNVITVCEAMLREFETAIRDFARGMDYLGPLREFPARGLFRRAGVSHDPGTWARLAHDEAFRRDLNETLASLTTSSHLEFSAHRWVREDRLSEAVIRARIESFLRSEADQAPEAPGNLSLMDEKARADLARALAEDISQHLHGNVGAQDTELVLRERGSSHPLTLRDVGMGYSQMLPLLIRLREINAGSLLIEQPELHVHPGVQCDLGDQLLRAALGSEGNIVLVETHSEHILLRVLRRIREFHGQRLPDHLNSLPLKPVPENIAFAFIRRQNASSGPSSPYSSRIENQRPLPEGTSLEGGWPSDFFGERWEEL